MTTASALQGIVGAGLSLSLAYSLLQIIDDFWFKKVKRKLSALSAKLRLNALEAQQVERYYHAELKVNIIQSQVDDVRSDTLRASVAHALLMALLLLILAAFAGMKIDVWIVLFVSLAAYGPPIINPLLQYAKVRKLMDEALSIIDSVEN